MFKILVVEDDKNLRKLIVTCLEKANYTVFESMNGERALDLMDKEYIDLIVTDIMMPEMNGYELIKELREAKYEVPILIITAKEDIEDKKQGFNLGADDYMVKPINIDELILRVKSLLKRTQKANEKILKFGEVTLDYDKLEIQKKGKIYQLTQKEFYLTYKLLSSPDKIFKRQELIEEIWGLENESDFRTVDVHIKRIREKLEEITEFEIITIRGIGYKAIIKQGE
ncbi:MAG: response regulator transcription factor [Clostridia bacterium]